MNIPKELPIIYTTVVLIPGYISKIHLFTQENSDLLDYLLENSKSNIMLGIIPIIDIGKVDNVIGTVCCIKSLIRLNPDSEEFFILVQGLCRFILDETIYKNPLKMNKIIIIDNFKELVGDENEKSELCDKFEKALNDMITYSEVGVKNKIINARLKDLLTETPLYGIIEYCLKIIPLTQADSYIVLRATNLNDLLKFVIYLLKREIINGNTKFDLSGLIPAPVNVLKQQLEPVIKNTSSSELNEILTLIQNSDMPISVNDLVMKEFKKLQSTPSFHVDYLVILNYLDCVVRLPWNISTKEILDLEKARSVLQLNHYGIDKIKTRIIQFIAVRILNPERQGPILCFVGPPGVGKTTIAKAIASSLNRTYKRISLGGINCSSDIKGHRKTFIGAMPGRIIQAISQAQTNNPVILLDEIDKMCCNKNGDPAAALLEVLDPEQNSSFIDSYVNLPFDLSRVMFISTANKVSYIPLTLRDRMEIIYVNGYATDEKINIAKNYLIPKIQKDCNMTEIQIVLAEETINHIIQNYTFEAGVRELQRKLEAIYHYIAVDIVDNTDKKKELYIITPESLRDILGNENCCIKNTLFEQSRNRVGVAIGLSWTSQGGIVQVIETSKVHSKIRLFLTGLIGQALKESVEIALNWIESLSKEIGLDIHNTSIHVHLPEGGQRKDGPSAGITIASALISLFWNVPLKPMIAMTGELSLSGYVLAVGGVKDKILAAYNSNIKTVIIPKANFLAAIDSLPLNIKNDINIIPVKHVMEVLDIVVPGGLKFLQNPTSAMPVSKI